MEAVVWVPQTLAKVFCKIKDFLPHMTHKCMFLRPVTVVETVVRKCFFSLFITTCYSNPKAFPTFSLGYAGCPPPLDLTAADPPLGSFVGPLKRFTGGSGSRLASVLGRDAEDPRALPWRWGEDLIIGCYVCVTAIRSEGRRQRELPPLGDQSASSWHRLYLALPPRSHTPQHAECGCGLISIVRLQLGTLDIFFIYLFHLPLNLFYWSKALGTIVR